MGVSLHYAWCKVKGTSRRDNAVVTWSCRWAWAEFVVLHWLLDLRLHAHDSGAKEPPDV